MCVRMLFFLGSHDSGANQDLDTKLPVANDEPNSIRVLGIAPCVKSGIKRWAVTQRYIEYFLSNILQATMSRFRLKA